MLLLTILWSPLANGPAPSSELSPGSRRCRLNSDKDADTAVRSHTHHSVARPDLVTHSTVIHNVKQASLVTSWHACGGTGERRRYSSSAGGRTQPPPGRFVFGRLVVLSGQVQKISPLPGFKPQTVHTAASRYTDWAMTAAKECFVEERHNCKIWKRKFKTVT